MKIKLKNGKAALPDDVVAFEHELGLQIDACFLEFVRTNDGAKPENNSFCVGETNGSGVNRFIPLKEISQEIRWIENLPDEAYPVAWAEGGNYVFINQAAGGAVFFWDHELPEETFKLSDDFLLFLESLEPFDIDSIEIQPGSRVIWVDQEFLNSVKDKEE